MSSVVVAFIGGYVALRVSRGGRLASAAATFRATIDPGVFVNQHGHALHGVLVKQFPIYRSAVGEFRRYLGPIDKFRLQKAWRDFHGGNEEHPNFTPYYTKELGHLILKERLETLRNVAQYT